MRIAAVADLHCSAESARELKSLFYEAGQEAELLVLAGDLTNMGRVEEMQILLEMLRSVRVPIVAVAGNHDHESDQLDTLVAMMTESGIHVLDGSTCEVKGVGFVGTKGFCGGFGNLAVQPFGEQALKHFIRSSIDEAAHLENAITKMPTRPLVAVLHYAPIKQTLEGESPELFAFLGSSLLAAALDRHDVDLILHGHAHNGSLEGRTEGGIPVHNVCRFVQKRFTKRPYALIDI